MKAFRRNICNGLLCIRPWFLDNYNIGGHWALSLLSLGGGPMDNQLVGIFSATAPS
jgi:hypothetical protein